MKKWNRRKRTLLFLALAAALLLAIAVSGTLLRETAMHTDFARKNLPPCAAHPFGTDWMGRDMLARTLAGLSLSIRIGAVTACVSGGIALVVSCCAALGRAADAVAGWVTDLIMGVPHILLLLLISIACGKGAAGVAVGISLTHWTPLARLLRGEILQIKESVYVRVAAKLGAGKARVFLDHMVPHLRGQFFTGVLLLFPHAVLHEASVTFLGFGLPAEEPAIGVILSESMRYLTMGQWWLGVFPGALLVCVVALFASLGENIQALSSPAGAHT